jgi:hypothetical protein
MDLAAGDDHKTIAHAMSATTRLHHLLASRIVFDLLAEGMMADF